MKWEDVRERYPDQWLLIEAIAASSDNGQRHLTTISVIETFASSAEAVKACGEMQRKAPARELYVFHTSRKALDITERRWLGIRGVP
jgi:hypothetical protein